MLYHFGNIRTQIIKLITILNVTRIPTPLRLDQLVYTSSVAHGPVKSMSLKKVNRQKGFVGMWGIISYVGLCRKVTSRRATASPT